MNPDVIKPPIAPAHAECTVLGPVSGWPRLHRVVVEEVRRSSYHHTGRDYPKAQHWLFKHTVAGAGEVDLGDGWRPLPVGQAFLARRGDPALRYRYPPGATMPWVFWYCAFEADGVLVDGLRNATGGLFSLVPRHPDLAALLACAAPGCGHRMLTAATAARLVHGLLATLLETVQVGVEPERDMVDAALARLGDPARPPTVHALAMAMGVSREHLSRMCHQRLGIPLQRYLQRRQMLQACALLGRPDASVSTVAEALGFDTTSHFARAFRRVWGVNPGVVRDAGGIPPS